MIEELTIQGFKSFGMDAPKINFGPLSFIVGANGSGKSNLLAALRFLRIALLEDLETAIGAFNGMEEIRNLRLRQIKEPKPVAFSLSIREPARHVRDGNASALYRIRHLRYRLEIDMRSDDGRPSILLEELHAAISSPEGRPGLFTAKRNGEALSITNSLAPEPNTPVTRTIDPLERSKLIGAANFLGEPMALFRSYVRSWRSYSISPEAARLPAEMTFGESMASTGERLGVILHEIQSKGRGDVLEAIHSAVRGFVPGFESVTPVALPVGRTKWGFKVHEAGLSRDLSPESVSDGTIRLITLIVIAEWCARSSALTMIEEPENGLHPHLTESIVGLFRSAAGHGQMIVTTHHSGFLDYLQPEELILCAREESGNTMTRCAAASEELQHFRKDFTLGELLTMNLL